MLVGVPEHTGKPITKMTTRKHLSREEKAVMEAYAKHGLSLAYISKLLSRQRTTISRHLRAKLLDLKVQERLKYKKRTDRMVSQIV